MNIRELKDLIENEPDEAEVWVGLKLQGDVRATGVRRDSEKGNSIDPDPVLIWGDDDGI